MWTDTILWPRQTSRMPPRGWLDKTGTNQAHLDGGEPWGAGNALI